MCIRDSYCDTRDTDRMRRQVERFNEAILSAGLAANVCAPMRRIFNRDFTRGGRFYAIGSSWQNMKSEA